MIRKQVPRTLRIETPRVFLPLLRPARYKGAFGGRGSGKSHFFAELLIEDCLCERGMLAVCIREVQKSLKDSSKRLIEAKLKQLGLGEADGFKVFENQIQTPGGGVVIFQGMSDATAEAIKSLEGFRRAWIEEAQVLSHRSLTLLRPTIRAKESQIWASWNPRRKGDAVDDFFRSRRPRDAAVVEVNWRDNPWFPKVLEDERLTDMRLFADRYEREAALPTKKDAKIGMSIAGPVASRMFQYMGAAATQSSSCVDGEETRVRDELMCTRDKTTGKAECFFGFDLHSGKSVLGTDC